LEPDQGKLHLLLEEETGIDVREKRERWDSSSIGVLNALPSVYIQAKRTKNS